MPNSYEHSYQHDLDNVIDASDAVLAIGTEKVDTTTLKDRSLNNNDATIHEAMPSSGYFLGRRFHDGSNYLDCGNDSSLNITDKITIEVLIKLNALGNWKGIVIKEAGEESPPYRLMVHFDKFRLDFTDVSNNSRSVSWSTTPTLDKLYHVIGTFSHSLNLIQLHIDGDEKASDAWDYGLLKTNTSNVWFGRRSSSYLNADIKYASIYNHALSENEKIQYFNTIARLPLYSHNFERYPNSDTSLTSVFPYTSGIITSGSFNKTDGLKCTSSGQIVFSNSFEFDGSEYITLIIDGVEYSGTTTVTQGTITATIAQGSNDITIDMGTNDVLEDIRVQFREEV